MIKIVCFIKIKNLIETINTYGIAGLSVNTLGLFKFGNKILICQLKKNDFFYNSKEVKF